METVNSKSWGRIATAIVVAATFVLAACSEKLSRDDFAARVKDKSDAEVAKLIGKPESVDASAPDQVTWTYTARTFNIEAGNKFDGRTIVVFSKAAADGKLKVTGVKYE